MEPPQLLHFLPSENPDGKNQTRAKKQRHKHIMGKLKDSVFTNIVGSNHPSGTLTQEAKAYIENKLRGMFQTFDTPTHPPYALVSFEFEFEFVLFSWGHFVFWLVL